MRVLVVDDSSLVRRELKKLFLSYPAFEVCGEADNGLAGLEKAAELRPDLIVIDFSMPVMNGLDAAREIHRAMPHVPIILFTVHSTCQKLELLLSAGISAVVDKGEPLTLLDAVRDLLKSPADNVVLE